MAVFTSPASSMNRVLMLLGGDGYTMFADGRVLIAPESGRPLVAALEEYLVRRGEVPPRVEGRINRAEPLPR